MICLVYLSFFLTTLNLYSDYGLLLKYGMYKVLKWFNSLDMFLHPRYPGIVNLQSINWNIDKIPITSIPKCAFMYKNGPWKLPSLPKACLDDCYYLFTNFFNEVTHKALLWGIFTISFKYSMSQRFLFSASWCVVRNTITIMWR